LIRGSNAFWQDIKVFMRYNNYTEQIFYIAPYIHKNVIGASHCSNHERIVKNA